MVVFWFVKWCRDSRFHWFLSVSQIIWAATWMGRAIWIGVRPDFLISSLRNSCIHINKLQCEVCSIRGNQANNAAVFRTRIKIWMLLYSHRVCWCVKCASFLHIHWNTLYIFSFRSIYQALFEKVEVESTYYDSWPIIELIFCFF